MSMAELQPLYRNSRLFVVMGVAGSGKTTIGEGVAKQVGGIYVDGDDLHPKSNIQKMSKGEPLTDDDRWPWLKQVAITLSANQGMCFIGCSALKRDYRDFITKHAGEAVTFIYLDGSRELIAKRMSQREGHFMPTSLLDSQFETLEVPTSDENKLAVDISKTQKEVIEDICTHITAVNS